MSRSTAILALVQTLVVILGFFALASVLKALGYPDHLYVHWNHYALFLRRQGMWLLILPILWVVLAARAERHDYGILTYRVVWLGGVCIAAAIIALFLYAAVFP
jgi:hypothetical protein